MKKSREYENTDRAWIEVNLDNIKHNAVELQNLTEEGCELMAVVKADAYGHGAVTIAKCLNRINVKLFAVATIDEGIELRKNGVEGEILILGYTNISRAQQLINYRLMQTVVDYDYAKSINALGYDIPVHIKINTGMNRLGIRSNEVENIIEIFGYKHLDIRGIFTHLCTSATKDEDSIRFTKGQIKDFYELIELIKQKGIEIPKIHFQSSYGLLNYPNNKCDYVRVGIALYGILSSFNDETRLKPNLRPALSLKSRIVLIREIYKGESVGYDRAFIAEQNSRIAIIPIGYADGIPRNLSSGYGCVLIHGQLAPIIGRICMDQLAVDITGISKARVGDIVTLIGKDGDIEISAAHVAYKCYTITNELLSRLGKRLTKIYIE